MMNLPKGTLAERQMRRLRLTFSRQDRLKWLSHLDMMRLWERALRRAEVPLAFSQGFTPHPRIAMALPLPVGAEGESELMDVVVAEPVALPSFIERLRPQLPEGVALHSLEEVDLVGPSLQSRVRFADYAIRLATGQSTEESEAAVQGFLAQTEAFLEVRRGKRVATLNLRALVVSLAVTEASGEACELQMRLRADSAGAGRPEEVARVLGFEGPPLAIRRTRLILDPAP